jgi:hypothetical protein
MRGLSDLSGCGKALPPETPVVAVYLRPDAHALYSGLRVLCSACAATFPDFADYVHGMLDEPMCCGAWVRATQADDHAVKALCLSWVRLNATVGPPSGEPARSLRPRLP